MAAVRLGTGNADLDPSVLPDRPLLGPPRIWTGPGAVLLHRQRPVTPEDLHETQPTPLHGGLSALLFDGRLDDRAGLCAQLCLVAGKDIPDSQLVARAFEKWEEDAPAHIIGDFALAVWDGRNRRALLCADRRGTRPLYFRRANNLLLFSTVLPALLSVPGVPCDLDEESLADLLFNNVRDSPHSFFRGIGRVLQSTTVIHSESGERVRQYWHPVPRPPLKLRGDSDYVEAAREVLDKAVASRLRSIAPVPIMGSGGLDSACIVASVLGQTGAARVALFTVAPNPAAVPSGFLQPDAPGKIRPRKYASERSAVLALQAGFPRIEPRFVEPAARPDMVFAPERIFVTSAVPLFNIGAAGWWESTFEPMRREGATSCLAGHMGNVTLSWDGLIALSGWFRRGRWLRMLSEAAALERYRPSGTLRSVLQAVLEPHLPYAILKRRWRRFMALNPRAEADLKMTQRLQASGDRRLAAPRDGIEQRVHGLTGRRALAAETYAWARAVHGIETRDPLDDVRLIEFCLSIPDDQFLRAGQTRWLARRLLRAAGAPPEISENRARGAWSMDWFARLETRRPFLEAEIALLRQSPAASRLLDPDRLARLVANWPANSAEAQALRPELEFMLNRALHVGAFIRWAEAKTPPQTYPNRAIVSP